MTKKLSKIFFRKKKFFTKNIFLSTAILASLMVLLKWYIPHEYQFIEPISLYGSVLSSVVFIYGFILAPAISEYKESERILTEIKNSFQNLFFEAQYFQSLQEKFDSSSFHSLLQKSKESFYYSIADGTQDESQQYLNQLFPILFTGEKAGIPANHIIRAKQEISLLTKSFYRISEIQKRDSLPRIIHHLKDFITFLVITTLLFLNIGHDSNQFIGQIQESVLLFLLSFLYIYLSFIINGFDNPFDKRRFSGYLNLDFLLEPFDGAKQKYLD